MQQKPTKITTIYLHKHINKIKHHNYQYTSTGNDFLILKLMY